MRDFRGILTIQPSLMPNPTLQLAPFSPHSCKMHDATKAHMAYSSGVKNSPRPLDLSTRSQMVHLQIRDSCNLVIRQIASCNSSCTKNLSFKGIRRSWPVAHNVQMISPL